MLRSASFYIACVMIVALLSASCGVRRYVVHAEDYTLAHQHGGLVGAVTMRCRETAVRAHRTRSVDIELDSLLAGTYDDYLAVEERSSRSLSLGLGIGGLLLGTTMGTMGGVIFYDAKNLPEAIDGDSLPENSGKILGGTFIASGVAFALMGIAFMAKGAARGAESPRRWQPSMTENTPCVVQRRDEAYARAERRAAPRNPELKENAPAK